MLQRRLAQLRKISLTYKQRLFVYSLLFSIVPVLLVGLYSAHISAGKIQEEVNHNQQMTLQQLKYQVDTFLYNIERTSLQIVGDGTIERSLKLGISMDNLDALNTLLDMLDRIKSYRSYADIKFDVSLIYNKYGYLYSNNYGIMNVKDFPYYHLLHTNKLTGSGSLVIPPNVYQNQKELLLIRSIQTSAAPAEGLLVMEVDARRFYEFFQSLEMGNSSRVVIVDSEGRVAMSQNEAEIGSRVDSLSPLFQIWQDPQPYPSLVTVKGSDYKVSAQKSSFNQWTYIAMTPQQVLTRKSDSINHLTGAAVITLIVLWTLLSFIGSRRMYLPLQRMSLKLPKRDGDVLQALDTYIDDAAEKTRHLTDQIINQKSDVRDYILLQLLRGEISELEFLEKSKRCEFLLQGQLFYVGLAEIDRYLAFKQKYRGSDRSLMMYALSKLIEEISEEFYPCAAVSPYPGRIAFILGVDEAGDDMDRRITELGDAIRSKVSLYFQFSLTVAVSGSYRHLNSINDGYDQALELLQLRFWLGDDRTISRAEMKNLGSVQQASKSLVKRQKSIVKSIAEGDLAKAEEQLVLMFGILPQTEANSRQVIGFFAHLIGEVDGIMEEMGYELSRLFEDDLYKGMYLTESMTELRDWFQNEFFPTLRRHLGQLNGSQKKRLVQQVIAYIHDRYETDLSLQQAADHFGLPGYQLSRYFKEEAEISYVDYVMQFRINKAKEWLTHSDMSIKEITERLRYATTQNFTRVFKQITGVPPGKYRSNLRQANE